MTEPRVAFVTGASRGIGKAAAIALAESGLDVVITGRTVREGDGVDDSDGAGRSIPGSLETTAQAIEATGRRALPVVMDLHDRSTLDTAVQRALDEWGRIDVLVNNAIDTGPGDMTRFEDTPLELLEAKLAANVVSQIVVIKSVLPGMLERGDGTIVNVTSAVAVIDPRAPVGEGGWGAMYAMSKGAFHKLAGILAVEVGDRGIRSFNLEPGFVITERMEVNAGALGLAGRYQGAPPSVPGKVIAWMATSPDAAVLNDDRDGHARVLCRCESDEPRMCRLAGHVLRGAGLAGHRDTGNLRGSACPTRDDGLHHLGELLARPPVRGIFPVQVDLVYD